MYMYSSQNMYRAHVGKSGNSWNSRRPYMLTCLQAWSHGSTLFQWGRLKSAWERPWYPPPPPPPSNTELHWRVYRNEAKISLKDFPKVNDPTISEFMATFSAWIRVPDRQVLRCGSLQNKSEKHRSFFCTSGAGAKDSEGVQSIGTRMGLTVFVWARNKQRRRC